MSTSHDDGRDPQTGAAPVAHPADPVTSASAAAPAVPAVAAPATPPAAATVFGDRLPLAERFTAILSDTGVSHGLIGPREVPILWERHVLNCAVVQAAFPAGVSVADIGSGAGLPGLALAIARPDLELHLVEPLLRRTTWLSATVDDLGLDNVTVHRGRAEELAGTVRVPWATARAVARLDKLARWTFPLLTPGGTLVALKGSSAADELAADEPALRRLGMVSAQVQRYGAEVLDPPTTTVELTVGETERRKSSAKGRRRR
jgi:16S rRNA (guanine527-N7)-methyltransferase